MPKDPESQLLFITFISLLSFSFENSKAANKNKYTYQWTYQADRSCTVVSISWKLTCPYDVAIEEPDDGWEMLMEVPPFSLPLSWKLANLWELLQYFTFEWKKSCANIHEYSRWGHDNTRWSCFHSPCPVFAIQLSIYTKYACSRQRCRLSGQVNMRQVCVHQCNPLFSHALIPPECIISSGLSHSTFLSSQDLLIICIAQQAASPTSPHFLALEI